jgi:hypothetical protein
VVFSVFAADVPYGAHTVREPLCLRKKADVVDCRCLQNSLLSNTFIFLWSQTIATSLLPSQRRSPPWLIGNSNAYAISGKWRINTASGPGCNQNNELRRDYHVVMLRRITKCATHVTVDRTTAPFVKLCDVHTPGSSGAGPWVPALRRRWDLESADVPNLPRSGDARCILSRRARSKRRRDDGKTPFTEPRIRRRSSTFLVVRAQSGATAQPCAGPLRHAICSEQQRSGAFAYHSVEPAQAVEAGGPPSTERSESRDETL